MTATWIIIAHQRLLPTRRPWPTASGSSRTTTRTPARRVHRTGDSVGITNIAQGRGLLTFDYDRDGDTDTFIVNNHQAPVLYRNNGGNRNNWLNIKTVGTISNVEGIGAFITVKPDLDNPDEALVWEMTGSSNSWPKAKSWPTSAWDRMPPSWIWCRSSGRRAASCSNSLQSRPNQLLTVVEPLPDYNSSGIVDTADYVVWRKLFGTSVAPGTSGDGNGDGFVDDLDYALWRRAYGRVVTAGTGVGVLSVPEPTVGAVVGLALAMGVPLRLVRRSLRGIATRYVLFCSLCVCFAITAVARADDSIARIWDEQLLDAIRNDTARPTVHARNLYHLSTAMYDAWAAYDTVANQVMHQERSVAADIEAARREAISFAAYNIIKHRFVSGPAGIGPGRDHTEIAITLKMLDLGYDSAYHLDRRQLARRPRQSDRPDRHQQRPGRRRERSEQLCNSTGRVHVRQPAVDIRRPRHGDERSEPLAGVAFQGRPDRSVRSANQRIDPAPPDAVSGAP